MGREPESAPWGPHPKPWCPQGSLPPLPTTYGQCLALPGHAIVVPTKAHGSSSCNLLDVVQVVCMEAAREASQEGHPPHSRTAAIQAHLPATWDKLASALQET